jgi:hypothetical protein
VSKGIALQKTSGILPEVEEKKGQRLSPAVLQTVIIFYGNNYSHRCPGKKNLVPVKQQLEKAHTKNMCKT